MIHLGAIDIRTDIFILLLSLMLLSFQLLLCFKVKKRILRLLPVIILLALAVCFGILSFVTDGWDAFGFLFLALCAVSLLFSCGMGFLIYRVVYIVRQQTK